MNFKPENRAARSRARPCPPALLIPCPPHPAVLYGSAQWSAGYGGEENPFDGGGGAAYSEEWSVFQKAFLFGIILAAVAIWVKLASVRRGAQQEVGYEKTLA